MKLPRYLKYTRSTLFASAAFVAAGVVSLSAEELLPAAFDVPYRSSVTFKNTKLTEDGTEPVGGGAHGRREYMMERRGGDLTPESMEAIAAAINEANASVSGTAWRNIGPTNATKFQNGVNVPAVDSGRARTILVDPSNNSRIFMLTSGGGLWRTDDITANKPVWTALSDSVGVAGGGVAFGHDANTLYLGTGDPFDFGAGGYMVKSTNGGQTWSAAVTLPGATRITDVKVDTSHPVNDVVLVTSDAGLFRSTDSGATYVKILSPNLTNFVWNLQRTSAGWLVTRQIAHPDRHIDKALYRCRPIWARPGRQSTWARHLSVRAARRSHPPATMWSMRSQRNLSGSAQKDMFKSVDGGLTWVAAWREFNESA